MATVLHYSTWWACSTSVNVAVGESSIVHTLSEISKMAVDLWAVEFDAHASLICGNDIGCEEKWFTITILFDCPSTSMPGMEVISMAFTMFNSSSVCFGSSSHFGHCFLVMVVP